MNKSAMQRLGVVPFDASEFLRDDEDVRLYLKASLEEAGSDATAIARAIGTALKARGAMAAVAAEAGLSRESLYKALSGDRDPAFSTVLKVISALGMRLTLAPTAALPASALLAAAGVEAAEHIADFVSHMMPNDGSKSVTRTAASLSRSFSGVGMLVASTKMIHVSSAANSSVRETIDANVVFLKTVAKEFFVGELPSGASTARISPTVFSSRPSHVLN